MNVAYEPKDKTDVVVFLSFNYLTGDLEKMYKIHKGTSNEYSNKMILSNVMSAAKMDGTGRSM